MVKIAIKGHPNRGKEVIQILESLGGINTCNYVGNNFGSYYELHGNSIVCMSTKSDNYKYYTLEEFEKEFPFKIGDEVITDRGYIGVIENLSPGSVSTYYVKTNDINYWCIPSSLKLYKEMKEERNITLTLDKAKEWYKKGGELKEIALQAFSEKELTKVDLPKTWKEFCDNYPVKKGESWIGSQDFINICRSDFPYRACKNWIPSQKSAEAHLAMIQLEQLRDCWRQGWKPDWLDDTLNYIIEGWRGEYTINNKQVTHGFLSFPTYKMAAEFLECFRDLIEKAGDLI